MELKPGYLVQPRAADIHCGEIVWRPIESKKNSDEVYFEGHAKTKKKKEKKKKHKAMRVVNPTDFESSDTAADEIEPQSWNDDLDERMRVLQIALEHAQHEEQAGREWQRQEEEARSKYEKEKNKALAYQGIWRNSKFKKKQ